MNITEELRNLISLQDNVTHLNENHGNIDATRVAIAERDELRTEIVEYVRDLRTTLLVVRIRGRSHTQKHIARYYRAELKRGVLWEVVNAEIITRWSRAGLKRIKKLAWGE